MNSSNNYHPVSHKDFLSSNYHPYLSTNSNNFNINNNNSIYLSTNSYQFKEKADINQNNYVKKSINLDIAPSINNSFNENKKENTPFLRYNSSFSNFNTSISRPNENAKKTLILDLDETLVHSAFTPFSRKSDIILNINIEGQNRTLYVLKRPFVDKFLSELSLVYEIFIFTASISQYANPLLDELDKNKYIKYRLFREHCTFENGIYIKDLKIFNRTINNMIIIDNNPLSYDNNRENGIPILSWYENINDNELLKLLPILKYMSNSNVQDVRTIITKIVNRDRNEIDYIIINKILNSNLNSENYLSNKDNLTTENKYRRNNKSQEPTSKIYERNRFNNNALNYNYNYYNEKEKILNNNYMKKYKDETDKNHNYLYDYNNEKINIDKKDPYGIRKSIFAPEEYNISNYKTLKNSYNINNNMDNYNSNNKKNNEDKMNLEMKEKNEYRNYLTNNNNNKYYNLTINREYNKKSLTPNINNRRKNNLMANDERISKKYSLVELTKKALHLDDDEYNKDIGENTNEYGTLNNSKIVRTRTLNKYNNYFNKENEIIYNEYININKYLSDDKSNKDFNKNSLNNKYYNNYLREFNNINYNNYNSFNKTNKNNKLILSKKMHSFNEGFKNNKKLLYKDNERINDENKTKLLNRVNNEKAEKYLNNIKPVNSNNTLYQSSNNFYNNYNSKYNYFSNYNQSNNYKDNYLNTLKNSLNQNKNNIYKMSSKPNIIQNNYINYIKNKNTNKNNFKYNFLDNLEHSNISNSIEKQNSYDYFSQKKEPVKNLKNSFQKNNEQYNFHHITRSSSFINLNSEISKYLDKFSLNEDDNKENINYNYNYNNNYEFNYNKYLNY